MNISLTPVILSILQIFGMFGIGAFAKHLKYFNDDDLNRLPKFIVDWLLPLLIFYSVTKNVEVEKFEILWPLPFIGFGLMAIGGILGFFLKKGLKSKDKDIIKTFHHFCAINNFSFLPIIILQNVLGETAIAMLFIMNLGSQFGLWTIGVGLLGEADFKKTVKNVFSPSICSLLIALVVSFLNLKAFIPAIVFQIAGYAGGAAVPLILISIGASLYSANLTDDFRDIIYLSFIRLILLPLILIFVLAKLPISKEIYHVAIVVALMPVAVSSTVLTRRFGGSPNFAGQAAIFTTLISIITVPLGLKIFG